MHSATIQLKEKFLDLLFPRQCIGCGKMGDFLCSSCAQSLLPLEPPYCKKCGASTAGEEFCPSCSRTSLVIDGIRSPFIFGGLIREAIHRFKYGNFKALAPSLAQLLAEYLYQNPLPVEVLVPVPIHKKRLRQRGYNQSSLLARELGKFTNFPVVEDSLFRSRNTVSQVKTTSAAERRENVKDAFQCQDEKLKGKNILLIDDVCTTGSTLNACAITLKAIGADFVWGLTLARE